MSFPEKHDERRSDGPRHEKHGGTEKRKTAVYYKIKGPRKV